MSAGPTFILGVGAQKAGTTSLHRYLCSLPTFAKPAMKEYHVWDEVYGIDGTGPTVLAGADVGARQMLRERLIAQPALYFDHFASLMRDTGKSLTADITPAYSGLPAEAFARIRSGFLGAGILVKVVFIIRDPVDRCWSAFRMYQQRQIKLWESDPDLTESAQFLTYAQSNHAQRRGRYERTIEALESVFAPEEICVTIFEQMFGQHRVEALSQFIDSDLTGVDLRRAHNAGSNVGPLPREVEAEVRAAFAETIRYCHDRYPATVGLWARNRAR